MLFVSIAKVTIVSEKAINDMQVIGVGGGGSNAVNRMLSGKLEGVDLFIINTDAQVYYSYCILSQ